jgi:hypothetical protein
MQPLWYSTVVGINSVEMCYSTFVRFVEFI